MKSQHRLCVCVNSVCVLTVIPSHMMDEMSAWTVCVLTETECVCGNTNPKSCDGRGVSMDSVLTIISSHMMDEEPV